MKGDLRIGQQNTAPASLTFLSFLKTRILAETWGFMAKDSGKISLIDMLGKMMLLNEEGRKRDWEVNKLMRI